MVYPVHGMTPGAGIGVGIAGYRDIVFIIPLIVVKCKVAYVTNNDNKMDGSLFGGTGGTAGHVPGFSTEFEVTETFETEPAAGIAGIGNGDMVAPVQYTITPFPNSVIRLNDGEFVFEPWNNANLKKDSMPDLFPTDSGMALIVSNPRLTAKSY